MSIDFIFHSHSHMYFRTILKNYLNFYFTVYYNEVYQTAPQPFVKLIYKILFLQIFHKVIQLPVSVHTLLYGITDLIILLLRFFIPADQPVVLPAIFILVLCHLGILSNELLHLVGQHVQV